MSWNAYLIDDRGHVEGDWNYTHNTNVMANVVLYPDYDPTLGVGEEVLGLGRGRPKSTWWKDLDGLTGPEGAALLNRIIKGMEADPEKFRKMNPDNGWGDYDRFLAVLIEMRDRVPEWPCRWEVNG